MPGASIDLVGQYPRGRRAAPGAAQSGGTAGGGGGQGGEGSPKASRTSSGSASPGRRVVLDGTCRGKEQDRLGLQPPRDVRGPSPQRPGGPPSLRTALMRSRQKASTSRPRATSAFTVRSVRW